MPWKLGDKIIREGRQTQGKMNNSEEYLRKTLAQKKKDFDAGGFE